MGLATYTVGLDSRVQNLMKLVNVNSNRVQVLGLHGIGGVGKTTLAKALYNRLVGHFEHRCFISDVRETSKANHGLVSLQNRILSETMKSPPVDEVDAGVSAIKSIFHQNRVLVVLDDVDQVTQLNALAGNIDWFSEGSRVIITTRNVDVLVEDIVNEVYEVRELYESEALQLFSYHALRREKPTSEYLNLSNKIVSLTGRLPLALEVFGSFLLHKRKIEEWQNALKELQKIRPQNLQDVLRISFDGLDEEEKSVFLDIACLLVKVGVGREEAIDILGGCGFRAEHAITVLTGRSLIKIREDYMLWMHDQLRDMGRQIVKNENLLHPGMRSRMWDHNDIMTVLKLEKGTSNLQGIVLDFGKNMATNRSNYKIDWNNLLRTLNFASALVYLKEMCKIFVQCIQVREGNDEEGEVTLKTKSFESMVNLRLLQIDYARVEGKFKCFPAELKWLRWKGCPLRNLPINYCLPQLAVLDLSESGIERVWGWGRHKVAENLKVLNLKGCYNLRSIPDLSGYKRLEKVDLELCVQLSEVHKSIGAVRTLIQLNLDRCSSLVEFPSDVTGLKFLQNLFLSGCSKLKQLPEDIGSMNSLKELLVDRTAITKLPESIYRLTKLEKLSLYDCRFIEQLPKCIGSLNSLTELSLDHTALAELPHSIGSLSNLEKLSLMWCASLTKIPESVGNLRLLSEFSLNESAITELPASIGSLSYLKVLSVGGCRSLVKLPDSIGELSSLSNLELDGTSITDMPDQVGGLKMIKKLTMRSCKSLESLPEAIGRMLSLTAINLFGANIIELPESIGLLENLVTLKLTRCKKLQKLPVSFGNLKSLHHLWMEHTCVTELPQNFGMLSNLMTLKMRKNPEESVNLQERSIVLPTSFSNLTMLGELDARAWRISGKIHDDFEKLSLLENLDLGYNNFHSLPSSLRGLNLLKDLVLRNCGELKSLPPLPSSLQELDASHCFALESISDVSNLERLVSLNLTNCEKVMDIPGIEWLKSLRRLFMTGCRACSHAVKWRLSKVCLRNMHNLCIPGSEIPEWFSPGAVGFSERNNSEIKAVLIGVVISVNWENQDDLKYDIPVLPDIEARIINNLGKSMLNTTLYLPGIPKDSDDVILLCRYGRYHPLVSMLRSGYKIEVRKRDPPIIQGVQLKRSGIHLVYENEDDYDANEELLDENQKSVSEKLAIFFNSL